MNKSLRNLKSGAQAGFTLVELVVVIVILGILAATAIPKFIDMAADARVAKMQAAAGAVKAGSALYHAQWLVNGSPADGSTVKMEGVGVDGKAGYPSASGIVVAAGGLTDYDLATVPPTATVLTVLPDANHKNCKVTYTVAVPSTVDATAATTANCS